MFCIFDIWTLLDIFFRERSFSYVLSLIYSKNILLYDFVLVLRGVEVLNKFR